MTEPSGKEPSAQTGYTIGPADVLQIIVWKEPDLTRDVTVRFDGMITLPLLGDAGGGRTDARLSSPRASPRSCARFVEVPRVTVGVAQANSARFYVVGQVGKSGEFPLSGRTTVLQALALAGGFKDFAKTDSIVIVRRDQTSRSRQLQAHRRRARTSRRTSCSLPGDTIVVP